MNTGITICSQTHQEWTGMFLVRKPRLGFLRKDQNLSIGAVSSSGAAASVVPHRKLVLTCVYEEAQRRTKADSLWAGHLWGFCFSYELCCPRLV